MLNIKALYNTNNYNDIVLYIPSCNNNRDIIINEKKCFNIIYDISDMYINNFINIIVPWIRNLDIGSGLNIIISYNNNNIIFTSTYLTKDDIDKCINILENLIISKNNNFLTPLELAINYTKLQNPKYKTNTIFLTDKKYNNKYFNDLINDIKLLGIIHIFIFITCDFYICNRIKLLNINNTLTFIFNDKSLIENLNKYLYSLNSYSITININNIIKIIPIEYNCYDNFILFNINYLTNPIITISHNNNDIYINNFKNICENINIQYFDIYINLNIIIYHINNINNLLNDELNDYNNKFNYKNINLINKKIYNVNSLFKNLHLLSYKLNCYLIPQYNNIIYLLNYINIIKISFNYIIKLKKPVIEPNVTEPIKIKILMNIINLKINLI